VTQLPTPLVRADGVVVESKAHAFYGTAACGGFAREHPPRAARQARRRATCSSLETANGKGPGREGERHFGCGWFSRRSRVSVISGPCRGSCFGSVRAATRFSQGERPITVGSPVGGLHLRQESGSDMKCPSRVPRGSIQRATVAPGAVRSATALAHPPEIRAELGRQAFLREGAASSATKLRLARWQRVFK
jgi:hypothetical protein